ncbi:MAG: ABC transporter ATP-binding protein [Candidatus Tectomicrobia bacterium RIFCSPLOWO2_12_FULL_69_37]|nr:MAG: ABC transporter ATP-binding protein [Candidatus Tectomicrobia bacterium RIFCSPLOWO2_02_FULL_70_19]OGL67485.1 MAG: ABC transporter ATP-binding protein [Candidatus Tectomicrobia bacterium RIFCSPLOWO2_12_FULL_69_37]
MLELRSVSKRFGGTVALQPTSLQIPAGKTAALIGPSGCGKSTLLRVMIGLVRADAGEVLFEDRPVLPENVLEARRRMGYVIQSGGLFPHLTVRGNITFMARYLGWPPDRTARRVEELVELTKFPAEGLDRYPAQVSGGQRQRVSLMRALMLDPHMLLLDEPFGALDPLIRSDLQKDLKEIFARLKKTVIIVTHDIGEAGFLADLIFLLKDGAVLQGGTLEDLVLRPRHPFVTHFINAQRSPLESLRPAEGAP